MKKLAWRNKKKVKLEKKNINLRRLFIKGDLTGEMLRFLASKNTRHETELKQMTLQFYNSFHYNQRHSS